MTSNPALTLSCAAGARNLAVSRVGAAAHDLEQQRLRILRCTAQAMASSPGGLRFKAGTRPWLEGLASGLTEGRVRGGLGRAMQAGID